VPVTIDIQKILDGILPQVIPLTITLMLYFFLSKRGWTPLKCIALLLVIGLIGSGFGLYPSIWPQ
jgi:PTS system N-acetylgalactosamine-specific IID component